MKKSWLTNAGKGYKVMSAGTAGGAGRGDGLYMLVTLPKGQGFAVGDRVIMKPVKRGGVEGLFIRRQNPDPF